MRPSLQCVRARGPALIVGVAAVADKDHCAGNGSLSGSIEHSEERSLCPRETLLGPVFGYLGYLATDAVQAAAHVVSPKPRFPAGRDPRFHYSRSPVSLIVSWRRIFAEFPGLKVLIYSGDQVMAAILLMHFEPF